MEPGAGLRGLRVRHDKHLYGELTCGCGHVNRSEPGRRAIASNLLAGQDLQ
jgi:hypothetical protein